MNYVLSMVFWVLNHMTCSAVAMFSHTFLLITHDVLYGGHSADLLFHIIISELQYIIPDSSPKILSGRENYLLGAFIY